jgi:hypothetical protein
VRVSGGDHEHLAPAAIRCPRAAQQRSRRMARSRLEGRSTDADNRFDDSRRFRRTLASNGNCSSRELRRIRR